MTYGELLQLAEDTLDGLSDQDALTLGRVMACDECRAGGPRFCSFHAEAEGERRGPGQLLQEEATLREQGPEEG